MLRNSLLGKQFWNMMKVFWVALAVYLALTIKTWLGWEADDVAKFDYIENENIQNSDFSSLQVDEELSHGAGSIFQKLCERYPKICKKVSRNGNFSDEDKSFKFLYVIYLLQNLDNNIKYWSKDPSQALEAMLINEQKWNRRWSANRSAITINLWWMKYSNEFFQVFSHEMWHIIDLWWLQWSSRAKSSAFTEFNKEVFAIDDPSIEYYKYSRSSEKVRKNWMSKEDFCSWYGMSDPFEDFAECHNLYLNHHDYFHKLALNNSNMKNKYNYFSNLYGWKYINNSEVKYENRSESYRAWDTTKLVEW